MARYTVWFLLIAILLNTSNSRADDPKEDAAKDTETTTAAAHTTTKVPDTTTKVPDSTTKLPDTTTKLPDTTTAANEPPKDSSSSSESQEFKKVKKVKFLKSKKVVEHETKKTSDAKDNDSKKLPLDPLGVGLQSDSILAPAKKVSHKISDVVSRSMDSVKEVADGTYNMLRTAVSSVF